MSISGCSRALSHCLVHGPLEKREGGRSDGLAMAFEFFVRNKESQPFKHTRMIITQNAGGHLHEEFTTRTAGDAPEHEEGIKVVEVGKVRNGMPKIDSESFVSHTSPLFFSLGGITQDRQTFRQRPCVPIRTVAERELQKGLLRMESSSNPNIT